uniref:Protein FAM207A-like n=1 Tax=Stegastes partitus TaxID=144197 RepID=A0A3B4ZCV8_9TELE
MAPIRRSDWRLVASNPIRWLGSRSATDRMETLEQLDLRPAVGTVKWPATDETETLGWSGWRPAVEPIRGQATDQTEQKISSIKQAKEQQVAEARRKATPVVGDMRPLADALPELCQLITPAATAPTARHKSRKSKTPEPTDFSQMKQSQKRKLL